VLGEARAAGSVQCGFSAANRWCATTWKILVAEAHRLGFYTNLLTSGIGFTPERAKALKDAGLDHVQLSFQDSTRELNDFLSHTKTFALKRKAARPDTGQRLAHGAQLRGAPAQHRLHRQDHRARRGTWARSTLELANSQYYSWAQLNRDGLMPSREQLERAERITAEYREKLGDKLRIFFVVPDYYETRPKKCMNGWGNIFLTITPDGSALPCHTAKMIKHLDFPSVKNMDVKEHLVRLPRLQPLPWRRVDERALQNLPRQSQRPGRLPLPSADAHGRAPPMPIPCATSLEHHQVVLDAVALAQIPDAQRIQTKPLVFRDPINSRKLSPAPLGRAN
jgi:pyrroloquinoline quinone biosynthesis protein E